MLEPFIDTVVICTITALVITVTVYDPALLTDGAMSGVELTSAAFASVLGLYLLAPMVKRDLDIYWQRIKAPPP